MSGALATGLPSAGTLAALLAGGAVAVAVLAVLMRRREDALPLLAVLALPFRVPVAADGRTVNLLIPLYVVIAAGTVAHLLPRLLAARAGAPSLASAESAGDPRARRRARRLQWLLLGAVVLYVLQIAYSDDRAKAAENVAFFYVPFGLLFVLLRDVRWTRELIVRCLALLAGLAVVLAGVGFVEYGQKKLFLNPKLVAANQYDNFFRVNSVFFDPSIYGRFLMLVMLCVMTAVLWGSRREAKIGAAVLAWLLAGLVTSFSQSSIAALLVGLAVLAAFCWGWERTAIAVGALALLAAAVVALAPEGWHLGLSGKHGSANNATTGRAGLVEGGLELFADRPLEGFGSGSFEREYKLHVSARQATSQNATSASHTIPVTVAAEQGIVGLAVYVSLLVAAFLVLFDGAGRSPPRIALAACFVALVLHTWTYADFLEDPFTWALLAIGVALARAPRESPATPPATTV
ncbi:MAG TPA: O-antigen ligase family protein [Solirubrobacteraceae bacterium]|nr:O-antigen ligase family protein [Solirubrobacteraceae bacterium]